MPENQPLPQPSSRRTVWVGVVCGLMAVLIWSGWTVATRFAMTTTLAPADVVFLRYGVSALFLFPILLRNGLCLEQIGFRRFIVMVAGAGIPFMLLSAIGMQFAPAAHMATFANGLLPVFVALLAAFLFQERFSARQLGGLAIVVAGVACIGGYTLVLTRASGQWRGDLLFMVCGLLFASYTLAQRHSGISSWHATALVNVTSGVLFTPVYFLWLSPAIFSAPLRDVLIQTVAQGIGIAILGLFFYAEAARRLGAPKAAIFGALTPVLAVVIGAIFLDEYPGWITLLGIALVSCGVVLVLTGSAARKT